MFLPVLKPFLRIALRIFSWILYFVTLIAAYGGRVDPAISTIPAVLVTALPYFVFATAIVILMWLCFRKYIMAALGFLTIVIAWAPISNAVPLGASKKAESGATTFTLLTYNIIHGEDQQNGNSGPGNRSFEYVINSGADIVCLQEVVDFFDDKEIPNISAFRDTLFKIYPYRAGMNINDQKVLSKYPVRQISYPDFFPGFYDAARYSAYEINIHGHILTLVNLHLNSYLLSEKERTMIRDMLSIKNMNEGISKLEEAMRTKVRTNLILRRNHASSIRDAIDRVNTPLILCGDFNDVPESYAYRLLRGDDLRDAYIDTSRGHLITYNRHAFWFHLDQILYRGEIKPLWVKKGKIKSSDHFPLMAEFEFLKNNDK